MEAASVRTPNLSVVSGAEVEPIDALLAHCKDVVRKADGTIEVTIPLSLISEEGTTVDGTNVDAVKYQMDERAKQLKENQNVVSTGQLSRMHLGLLPGSREPLIIDGFHRQRILKDRQAALGLDDIDATALLIPIASRQEITDMRMAATVQHESIQFARTIQWTRESWQDLVNQTAEAHSTIEYISPLDALRVVTDLEYVPDEMTLTDEERRIIREWAEIKAKKWNTSILTLRDNLLIAEMADPALINAVRPKGHASEKLKALTAGHLKSIAEAYPTNYAMQNLLAEAVITRNLSQTTTGHLAAELSSLSEDAAKVELQSDEIFEYLKPQRTAKKSPTKRDRFASQENDEKWLGGAGAETTHSTSTAANFKTTEPAKVPVTETPSVGPTTPTSESSDALTVESSSQPPAVEIRHTKETHKDYQRAAAVLVRLAVESAEQALALQVKTGAYLPERIDAAPSMTPKITGEIKRSAGGWSEDQLESAMATLAEPALEAQLVKQLTHKYTNITRAQMARSLNTAKQRLTADVIEGGLSKTAPVSAHVLKLLLGTTAIDEVVARREEQHTGSSRSVSLDSLPTITRTIDPIAEFSYMDPEAMRVTILNGVFRFSPFVMSRLLGKKPAEIGKVMAGIQAGAHLPR